jgi:hypothetical protein
MFILEGRSSDHQSASTHGAFFLLGTDQPCHGALIATVGIEGDRALTIPLPTYQGDVVTLPTQGLRLRRCDAIEIGGYRYSQATGELKPGQFHWDETQAIILIKLLT